MREKEYAPLLPHGFKDITEADLYNEFVAPFWQGKAHREQLLQSFQQFLKRFKALGLPAELWIDGSFATHAPDPADIDMVFYFNPTEIDSLPTEKQTEFKTLFQERKFMKNLYQVEVFYAQKDNIADYAQWLKSFGTMYDDTTPKGIFRIQYT